MVPPEHQEPLKRMRDFLRFAGADVSAGHVNWALDPATTHGRAVFQLELALASLESYMSAFANEWLFDKLADSAWFTLSDTYRRLLNVTVDLGGIEESRYE